MRFLAALGIGVVSLFCVLAALVIRRALIVWGGGSIVMNVRLSTRYPGLGRFVGDELRWHRIFSLSLRPRAVLRRADVQVRSRRTPDEMELLALPDDCVVLRCETRKGQLDIAMRHSALNGFLSWLEAAPPGAASRRLMVY